MDKISIIRINPNLLSTIPKDTVRMRLMGIKESEFLIPTVKVFKGKLKGEVFFEDRPLLLSYGFLRLPISVLSNREAIKEITSRLEVVQGFFLRNAEEVKREVLKVQEAHWSARDCGTQEAELFKHPVLVKTIRQDQVDSLFERARQLDTLSVTTPLEIGSYLVLQNYPFEGLSAVVLEKRSNGRIKLELLDSGVIITQQYEELVYTLDESYLFNT